MPIQEQDKSDVKGLRDWYHVYDGSFYHPHEAKICKIYQNNENAVQNISNRIQTLVYSQLGKSRA